jgi:hypothetical protein
MVDWGASVCMILTISSNSVTIVSSVNVTPSWSSRRYHHHASPEVRPVCRPEHLHTTPSNSTMSWMISHQLYVNHCWEMNKSWINVLECPRQLISSILSRSATVQKVRYIGWIGDDASVTTCLNKLNFRGRKREACSTLSLYPICLKFTFVCRTRWRSCP